MLDDLLRDGVLGLSVLAGLEEVEGAHLHHVGDFREVERRVDADAHEVGGQLVGVHAAHAGADDDAEMLLLAKMLEERQRLRRIDGNVGGLDVIVIWQGLFQVFHGAALP